MRTLLALSLLSIAALAHSQESASGSATTVEEVVGRIDALRDSFDIRDLSEGVPAWPNREQDVARAKSELASRLKARPQDTQTLLLWARAGFQEESLPAPEAALDRVIAAEPQNAEALYYKGRIYGRALKTGGVSWRWDLSRAVPFIRQAVELAPNNLKYRRTLAIFLLDQGRLGEAKLMFSTLRKDDPMIRLIEELDAVSIPDDAEYLLDHPLFGVAMLELLASNTIEDYLDLRLRLYRIPKSPRDIEAFYASRIRGFRLLGERGKAPGERVQGEPVREYAQFIRIKSGTASPSRAVGEIPDPRRREPGILMLLTEWPDDPDLGRTLGPGENNCYLLLMNTRR